VRAQTILFDLDGTLSDSARGILAALRHAFAVNGLPPMDAATERAILGPPFHESLPAYLGGVPLGDVVTAYREHYLGGAMFDTSVYAGIHPLLAALQDADVTMAVATSKPEFYATAIVDHLGLSPYFRVVGGDVPDGSGTKADVIGRVLQRLGDPDPADVLMVGDRRHDVEGARVHGIDTVGVRWGYALPGELEAAGAWAICASPAELAALIEAGRDAAAC
jgi:phosphoglycolate phosphatase